MKYLSSSSTFTRTVLAILLCLPAGISLSAESTTQAKPSMLAKSIDFDSEPVTNFVYSPTGFSVNFTGLSGVTQRDGSFGSMDNFGSGQVAFVQRTGEFDLAFAAEVAGWYRVAFDSVQRNTAGVFNEQTIAVSINGEPIAKLTPSTRAQTLYSAQVFLGAGLHNLAFAGEQENNDYTAFIDNIEIRKMSQWSDVSTWDSGVPGANSAAVIPEDAWVYTSASAAVESVDLRGVLAALPATDLSMRAKWIIADGSKGYFELGHPVAPHTGKVELILVGDRADVGATMMGGKVLGAKNNARIEMHGQPRVSWTRLAGPVPAGGSTLVLQEAVDWVAGDELVITSNRVAADEAETKTVVSTSADGRTVTLDSPLVFPRLGDRREYTRPDGSVMVADARVEVGLLTHNVKVRGDNTSADSGYGGHIMATQGSLLNAAHVELYHMGQRGLLGRYPWHWHLLGEEGAGQYLKNSSVHRSFNRAIVVHGTWYSLVEGNVAFDHIGHGVMLEDGSERYNIFRDNLALLTRRPSTEDAITPSDLEPFGNLQSSAPSTYWITNPNNYYEDNVAAGSEGTGFWFAFPLSPTGASATDPRFSTMRPNTEPLGSFNGNIAHSNLNGLDINDGLDADHALVGNKGWDNPDVKVFSGLNFFSNRLGIYAGIGKGRVTDVIYYNTSFTDNERAIMFATAHRLENSLVVATQSGERINPTISLYSMLTAYDGPAVIYDSHLVGYNGDDRTLIINNGAAVKWPSHQFRGITWGDPFSTFSIQSDLQPLFEFRSNQLFGNFLYDDDGSLTGRAQTTVVPALDFYVTSTAQRDSDWGEYTAVEERVVMLGVNNTSALVKRITEGEETKIRKFQTAQLGILNQIHLFAGTQHTYEITLAPSYWNTATGGGIFSTGTSAPGEPIIVRWLGAGQLDNPRLQDATEVTSLAQLRATSGNAYFTTSADLYTRTESNSRLLWDGGTVNLLTDTDGDGTTDAEELQLSTDLYLTPARAPNPLVASDGGGDRDGDGISNALETANGTDSFLAEFCVALNAQGDDAVGWGAGDYQALEDNIGIGQWWNFTTDLDPDTTYQLRLNADTQGTNGNGTRSATYTRLLDNTTGIFQPEVNQNFTACSTITDTDGDKLADVLEVTFATDPSLPDTDNDLILDGLEVQRGTNPLIPEFCAVLNVLGEGNIGWGVSEYQALEDNIGLGNYWYFTSDADPEQTYRLRLNAPTAGIYGSGIRNTTFEKLLDQSSGVFVAGVNQQIQACSTFLDRDGDRLADIVETTNYGTSTIAADTDGDSIDDRTEVETGTNPLMAEGCFALTSRGDQNIGWGAREYQALEDTIGLGNWWYFTSASDADQTYRLKLNGPTLGNFGGGIRSTNYERLLDSSTGFFQPGVNADFTACSTFVDNDGDRLADVVELNVLGTDPASADTDSDGTNDNIEISEGTDPLLDQSSADSDGDGIVDLNELNSGTDPDVAEMCVQLRAIGDVNMGWGLEQYNELENAIGIGQWWYFTTDADSDQTYRLKLNNPTAGTIGVDGTRNTTYELMLDNTTGVFQAGLQQSFNACSTFVDNDGDRLADIFESTTNISDVTLADTDGDSLNDGLEVDVYMTDPRLIDTDADNLADNIEVAAGTDPTTAEMCVALTARGDENIGWGARQYNVLEEAIGLGRWWYFTIVEDPDQTYRLKLNTPTAGGFGTGIRNTNYQRLRDGSTGIFIAGVNQQFTACSTFFDNDGDRLADVKEVSTYLTDPQLADTDADGLDDGAEIALGTDPNVADTDEDGISDFDEASVNADPLIADTDGDSINDGEEVSIGTNPATSDTDNDGLTDEVEVSLGTSPNSADTDSDGISDAMEVAANFDPIDPADGAEDADGDTISNGVEGVEDTDGDGLANFLDTDSDNDGLLDINETDSDTDLDGIANFLDLDSDNDGLTDEEEGGTDTDGDRVADFLDRDSDNDGITDLEESIGTVETIDPDNNGAIDGRQFVDENNNGLSDGLERFNGENIGTSAAESTIDADTIPNHLDSDSDGDGAPDAEEGTGDSNGNGVPDYIDPSIASTLTDRDGDGLSDELEGTIDSDNDGTANFEDVDSDNDGISDQLEATFNNQTPADYDGDGIADYIDIDSDNDSIIDSVEGTEDRDGDGIADFRDLDTDNDGIFDLAEAQLGTLFLQFLDENLDGMVDFDMHLVGVNGLAQIFETAPDSGELSNELPDSDNDSIHDYLDLDTDNDGILDAIESRVFLLSESDAADTIASLYGQAGLLNDAATEPRNSAPDQDGDGVADFRDIDSDNDGLTDLIESGGFDDDNNGRIDTFIDSNGDGADDNLTASPPLDTDGDSLYDFIDIDSDQDGLSDLFESGGQDADGNGVIDNFEDVNDDGLSDQLITSPIKPIDADADGQPDHLNVDRDNIGQIDLGMTGQTIDTGSNGDSDSDESIDQGSTSVLTVGTGRLDALFLFLLSLASITAVRERRNR